MSDELLPCPQCQNPYAYFLSEGEYTCGDCNHTWNPHEVASEKAVVVKDANGNILQNGDSVIVIKTLNVKGAQGPIKAGTKVKNIRLVDGDHDIDCKIKGFGAMALKSEFVKKA